MNMKDPTNQHLSVLLYYIITACVRQRHNGTHNWSVVEEAKDHTWQEREHHILETDTLAYGGDNSNEHCQNMIGRRGIWSRTPKANSHNSNTSTYRYRKKVTRLKTKANTKPRIFN